MTAGDRTLVRWTGHVLEPDATRVVAETFLPGQELMTLGASRASAVLDRVMAMTEREVALHAEETLASFGARHHDLPAILAARFDLVAHRLDEPNLVSLARRTLIGAYFTREYAVESAALFNPSIVVHPDQSGLPVGSARFVMSLRGVGEGHLSCIEFRTGHVDEQGDVHLDAVPAGMVLPMGRPAVLTKAVFAAQLAKSGQEHSSADFVLGQLPDSFSHAELADAISSLQAQGLTRGPAAGTAEVLQAIAASNYSVEFPDDSDLAQRVLMPRGPAESHGMEDLRLVRFTEDDGTVDYRGTYTAFDGSAVAPHMLTTTDFRRFEVAQLGGPAAVDKGMALFPRRVNGAFVALSRWDRENNTIAMAGDDGDWREWAILQAPRQPWELVHVGNCGSPIETSAGWLVLTHGVGPMRSYSMGAMLLDLEDPRVVVGRLADPLITPPPQSRDGYVPNVVYSCGAMVHGDALVVPCGFNDRTTRIAVVDLPGLLSRLAG